MVNASHRPQRLFLTLAVWLLPAAALLYLGRHRELRRGASEQDHQVQLAAARIGRILDKADVTLARLAADTGGRITPEAFNQLRRQMYIHREFREVGIVSPEGNLVATSLGVLEVPIAVPAADRSNPNEKGAQIVGLRKSAIMGEESIIIGLPTEGKGEVNLLVDPVEFREAFDESILLGRRGGERGAEFEGAFACRLDGQPPFLTVGARLDPAAADANAGHLSEAALERWHLRLSAYRPDSLLLADWPAGDLPLVSVALALNGLGIYLVNRFNRRPYGWGPALAEAMREGQLALHYQPIVALRSGAAVGVEALVRWNHPQFGPVKPDQFIPAAEESGQITPLTYWIFERALRDLGAVFAANPELYVSINVASSSVDDADFARRMERLLAAHPAAAGRVLLELTERAALPETAEAVDRLRAAGFRIALDDFGTGYSNLASLHKYRFDVIKFDRSFLKAIGEESVAGRISETVIELARKLDSRFVAEGVETERQSAQLVERGIELGQGWLFAKAMTVEALGEYLAERAKPSPAG